MFLWFPRPDWSSLAKFLEQRSQEEIVRKMDFVSETDLDANQRCFFHRVLLRASEIVGAYKECSLRVWEWG